MKPLVKELTQWAIENEMSQAEFEDEILKVFITRASMDLNNHPTLGNTVEYRKCDKEYKYKITVTREPLQ